MRCMINQKGEERSSREGKKDNLLFASNSVASWSGAIGSPQLLQLSGVGDPAHLAQVGVAPLVELPQAGLEKTRV